MNTSWSCPENNIQNNKINKNINGTAHYYIFQQLNNRLDLHIVSLMHRNSPSTWTKQIRTLANINQGNKTPSIHFLSIKAGILYLPFHNFGCTRSVAVFTQDFDAKIWQNNKKKTAFYSQWIKVVRQRFVGFTLMIWISGNTTSQKCSLEATGIQWTHCYVRVWNYLSFVVGTYVRDYTKVSCVI